MYIVIGGGGMVGSGLAKRLVANRHDVVVVERDKALCEATSAATGALLINGNATSIDILEEARMTKAEVAVAAMPRDADNLAFTLLAKKFEVPRVIARMRDPRYEDAYKMAGVTKTINICDLFVSDLVLEIERPAVRQVATFGRGRASIVVVRVPEGAFVDGKSVQEIVQYRDFPKECVVAGIFREATEEFVFPRGGIELRAGDQVFLTATTETIRQAADFLQNKTK